MNYRVVPHRLSSSTDCHLPALIPTKPGSLKEKRHLGTSNRDL